MAIIPLEMLIPHGKVTTKIENETLILTTNSSITSIAYNLTENTYKRHFIEIPTKAHIPFSFKMKVKLDYMGLIFLIGNGHVIFNCPCNRTIEDIIKITGKTFLDDHKFDNNLPCNTFVDLTITYGLKEMQILVDGKEAFYSNKLPYMKDKELLNINEIGFTLGFEVAKLSTLLIKDIELISLNKDEALSRKEPYHSSLKIKNLNDKPTFDCFTSRFSSSIQNEIIKTDAFLKSLKTLNIKRIVDPKGDKLTFSSSSYGISYIIRISNDEAWQNLSFYIVTSGKAETWHRKADYMEETLQEINKKDPQLSERLFNALNDCVGCYGSRCIVKTLYNFQGRKKLACHGVIMLRLCPNDFQDIRSFFFYYNTLIENKINNHTLHNELIYLIK